MNQENNMDKIYYNSCPICKHEYCYTNKDIWFDNTSMGYSVKLVKCPHCNKVNKIRYYEENLDVNNDERYYEYIKKID